MLPNHAYVVAEPFRNLPAYSDAQELKSPAPAAAEVRLRQASLLTVFALLGVCAFHLLDAGDQKQPTIYPHLRHLRESAHQRREGNITDHDKLKHDKEKEKDTSIERHQKKDKAGDSDRDRRSRSEYAGPRDDNLNRLKDTDKVYRNGTKLKAIGDQAHATLCIHADEAQFQVDLILKLLRCECSWEPEDCFGVFAVFVVSLAVMVLFRAKGNRRRNSFKQIGNWFCSCSTVFAVLVTATLGYGRGSCFTWADVCYSLAFFLFFSVPCCWCWACCSAEDISPERHKLEDEEDACLLCDCVKSDTTDMALGDALQVTPLNSREVHTVQR